MGDDRRGACGVRVLQLWPTTPYAKPQLDADALDGPHACFGNVAYHRDDELRMSRMFTAWEALEATAAPALPEEVVA
jgi:hypothetical protein